MKLLLFVMLLLLFAGSSAVEGPLHGKPIGFVKTSKSGAKQLRIAVVQMKSLNHNIDGNLRQATTYANEAAARGAEFVLFPEFMATGSYLFFDTWDSAK